MATQNNRVATFAMSQPATIPMPAFISQAQVVGQDPIPPLPRGVTVPPPGAPQVAIRQPPNPLGVKHRFPRIFPFIKKHNEKIDGIITKIGRVGFIARGFIWASIGAVCLSTVASNGAVRPQSQTGALDAVADAVGGNALLGIATVGILFYAFWRTSEFLWGLRVKPEHATWKKYISGYMVPFCSLIFYGIFAYSNVHEIIYNRRQGGQGTFWNRLANEGVGGAIFLTLCGILLSAVALGWLAQIIKGDILGEMMNHTLINKEPKWVKYMLIIVGSVGTLGRVFLFSLVGALFIRMAWFGWSDPNGTFGSALAQLDTGTVGRVFLAIEGILLIIFGVWSVLNARYKEFLPYKAHIISPDSHAKAEAKIAEKLGPKVGGKFTAAIAWIRSGRTEYKTAEAQGQTDEYDKEYRAQRQRDMEAQYSPGARRNTPSIRKKSEVPQEL